MVETIFHLRTKKNRLKVALSKRLSTELKSTSKKNPFYRQFSLIRTSSHTYVDVLKFMYVCQIEFADSIQTIWLKSISRENQSSITWFVHGPLVLTAIKK